MKLTDPLVEITRILPNQAKSLEHLGIKTIRDLLYHFPNRYGDTAEFVNIELWQKVPHRRYSEKFRD